MGQPLHLLVDYQGHFWSSTRYSDAGMRLDLLEQRFEELGYDVRITPFAEIDHRSHDMAGDPVLYQSTEDPGLAYHSFIEDVLLALQLRGARLIPSFPQFRAHHNKVFMEMLRDVHDVPELHSIRSRGFGSLEEFMQFGADDEELVVMKPAGGAKSSGVRLMRQRGERIEHARRLSRTRDLTERVKEFAKPLLRPYHEPASRHRRKFIAQTLIPGLAEDYKVICYGSRFYVLERRVRKDDFRASGSGLFAWTDSPPPGLLDLGERLQSHFDVPFISLDIAFDGQRLHVFEFQFVHFGNVTVEKSRHCFMRQGGTWTTVSERPRLESVFAESVHEYLSREPVVASHGGSAPLHAPSGD